MTLIEFPKIDRLPKLSKKTQEIIDAYGWRAFMWGDFSEHTTKRKTNDK